MKQYLTSITFLFMAFQNHATITIDQLTLEQKIGQLFMVAAVADEEVAKDFIHKKPYRLDKEYIEELITNYHIGGIIYLGKSDSEKQIQRTQYFQSIAAIPLLIGQDLEPGRVGVARLQEMHDFPNNKTLGENNDIANTYQIGVAIGKLCKELGVHINFAPVADVNSNPHNPVINDRSFGDNPELVTRHAIAFACGLHDTGIIACAKHFPGHGDTNVDSHYDLPLINHDKNRLHAIELYPFKKLIAENIPAIMVGHLEVPAFEPRLCPSFAKASKRTQGLHPTHKASEYTVGGQAQKQLPSSLSKTIVTDVLQKELGFKGLVITDGLDMQGVTKYYTHGQAELAALLAGNDILLSPTDVPAAVAAIKQALADNLITEQEINTHVEKILHVKNLVRDSTFNPNSPL